MENKRKTLYEVSVDEQVPLITNHNLFRSSSDSSDEVLLPSKPCVQINNYPESLTCEDVTGCGEATPLISHSKIDYAIQSDGFSCVNNSYEEVG